MTMINKDIIGRQFKFYGRDGHRTYYHDVDGNVYFIEVNKVFYAGQILKGLPFERALKQNKYEPVFQVKDWSVAIFQS